MSLPLPDFYEPQAGLPAVHRARRPGGRRRRGVRREARHQARGAGRVPHRGLRHRRAGGLLHAGREPLRARRRRGHAAHRRVAVPEPGPGERAVLLAGHPPVFQIFHPAWWVDEQGKHPAPLTPIFHDEVRKPGKWSAVAPPEGEPRVRASSLEATGKYVLTVWPYHTLLGGLSHALVPAMMEAALFHAAARAGTRRTSRPRAPTR